MTQLRAALRHRTMRAREQALRQSTALLIEPAASSWCASPGATCTASRAARRWSLRRPRSAHARRRRHGQHPDAQGHLGPHGVQGVRARAARRACRASSSPATCCCWPIRPASGNCPGRRAPAGCARQPWFQDGQPVELDTRRMLQRALARLADAGLGDEVRAGDRVPHLPHRRRAGRSSIREQAAWPGAPPAVQHDPPGLQPADRSLVRHGGRAAADRAAHGAGARAAAAVAGDRTRARARSKRCSMPTDALTAADNMVLFRNAREAGAAPRRLPRHLHVPAALSQHHVQRLAPAPVAGRCAHRRATRSPRRARRTAATPTRCAAHALATSASTTWPGCWSMRRGMARVLHADRQRLRPLPAERAGAAVRAVGPRQPRRDAARDRRVRRRGDAHREPHRRAGGQSLSVHRVADPRRTRRHRARG